MTLCEEIERAINLVEDDCTKLEVELGGCRELCQRVLAWMATGRELVERLHTAERIIQKTIDDGNEVKAALVERLESEADAADWWKNG